MAALNLQPSKQPILDRCGGILLVDDEQLILDVVTPMLQRLGYHVFVASGGFEALEIYQRHRDHVDLVILDMIMPEISGGETFDRLRRIHPQAKVLLSSGYCIEGLATEILDRGCNGFLQKPFTLNSLSQKISEILQKDPD